MIHMKTTSTPKPKGTKAHEELLYAELAADPEFAGEWERLALARTVAIGLIGFRSDNQLSQRELAELLGVSQPRVVELESGEKNPQIETLLRIARARTWAHRRPSETDIVGPWMLRSGRPARTAAPRRPMLLRRWFCLRR